MPEATCPGWMKTYYCRHHDLTWNVPGGPHAMPCPYCEQSRAEEHFAAAERNRAQVKEQARIRGAAPHLPDEIP